MQYNIELRILILGILIGFDAAVWFYELTSTSNHRWQSEAIEHGAGYYNVTNGDFEWNTRETFDWNK